MSGKEQGLGYQAEREGPPHPATAVGHQAQEGYVCCAHDAGSWEGILLVPTGQQL